MENTDFKSLIAEKQKEQQEKKSEFNIFTALHKEREEKGLHSRFIAYLLNPKSKHNKGNLFLKLFIQELSIEFPDIKNFDVQNCEVKPSEDHWKEKYDIDILIINEKAEQAIIIENKIDAKDSTHEEKDEDEQLQLDRYYKTAKKEYPYYDDNFFVVYLTLDRHKPYNYEKIKNFDSAKIKCIDYRTEIKHWLEKCENSDKLDAFFKEIIRQYKNLTIKITNDVDKAKKIQKSISENIEIAMKYINELNDLEDFIHVKWHTVAEFFYELKKKLEENSYEILDFPDNEKITAVTHKDKKSIANSLVIKFKNAEKEFYIANDCNGLTYSEVGNESNFIQFSEKIKFYDFTNEKTFNLINPKNRAEIIKELVEQISKFVTNKNNSLKS